MPRRRRYRPNVPYLCALGVFVLAIVAYIAVGVMAAAFSPRWASMPAGWMLPLLARTLDAVSAVWFFAVGASIGSFLNVVAYRLPLGKSLGGHSACPFCCTPIAAADNIPVFAWLRLRGRCRTCRLPISIEYPLIELLVGLIFLVVYFSEFAVAGSNLPGAAAEPIGSGLVWMSVTPLLATRVLLYLFALSGLVAAALIVLRRADTPLSLFAWILLIVIGGQLVRPAAVVVPWWLGESSRVVTRIDVVVTVGLGWLAGLMAAALTLPLLRRATSQVAWYGTLSCVGAIVGWQWVAPATACILLVALLLVVWLGAQVGSPADGRRGRGGLRRWAHRARWVDPVAWAWLGLLIFRANWNSIHEALGGLNSPALWVMVGCSGLIALTAAWLVGRAESFHSRDGTAAAMATAQAEEPAEAGLPGKELSGKDLSVGDFVENEHHAEDRASFPP